MCCWCGGYYGEVLAAERDWRAVGGMVGNWLSCSLIQIGKRREVYGTDCEAGDFWLGEKGTGFRTLGGMRYRGLTL